VAREWSFEAELWRWQPDSGWHFVTLPTDVADEIDDEVPDKGGFGSVRVVVTVGATTWSTSVFPDAKRGSFVLPVKQQVRRANDVEEGDRVGVRLRLEGGES
jgi:hypothetical protein